MSTERCSVTLYTGRLPSDYVHTSASRNILIISDKDPENSPESWEFLYLYGNHWLILMRSTAAAFRCPSEVFSHQCETPALLLVNQS